jgi:hypothetical protein
MAYNEQIIPILDLRKSTALGVAIPFSAPTVFTSVYSTKEQTKYNLINFLLIIYINSLLNEAKI